jgi:hypothetical protein
MLLYQPAMLLYHVTSFCAHCPLQAVDDTVIDMCFPVAQHGAEMRQLHAAVDSQVIQQITGSMVEGAADMGIAPGQMHAALERRDECLMLMPGLRDGLQLQGSREYNALTLAQSEAQIQKLQQLVRQLQQQPTASAATAAEEATPTPATPVPMQTNSHAGIVKLYCTACNYVHC